MPDLQLHSETTADRFTAGLKAAGLKVTAQRQAICRALSEMQGKDHPTAQEVFDASRKHNLGVSLATVYNTLAVLRDTGLLYELGTATDGALHYELDTHSHVNSVCIKCKKIVDIPLKAPAGLEAEVAERSGFHLLGGQVLFYGYCPDCQDELN